MAYRSELEARLAKKTTKAIVDFEMIEDGDRVMVGLSGGKDSWALLQMLDVLRQRAPIRFSLVAVNVDSGYKEYKHELIASTCHARGWEYRIEHTGIGQTIDDILDDGATPCSLCARLRRGVLYRIAKEVGATKIALGHHADDFIETLLLNLFFAGALKAMPAKLVSDDGAHVVIRPLVYVGEDEARAYTKESELPIIGCCCPACGDLGLQRQRAKRLLMELEREHPGVKTVDAEGARQRRAAPSARHAAEPAGGAARTRSGVMRAVVQRVSSATVIVGERTVGRIGHGLLVFVGVETDDGPADVRYIASKVGDLRVFEDDDHHMNRSVQDVAGGVLVVSQFTLAADCRKGRRPSCDGAAAPSIAQPLYQDVVSDLRARGLHVETGEFRAAMQVVLVNDGPVTMLLDSRRTF